MSKPRGEPASKPKSVPKSVAGSVARRAGRDPGRAASPELRIGTSGWHYGTWRGPFYPAGLKPKDFLSFYLQHFNTTEINNSFYRLPTEAAVRAYSVRREIGFASDAAGL